MKMDSILQALEGSSWDRAREAIQALAHHPGSDALSALVGVLNKIKWPLSGEAAQALGVRGDRAAIAPLREAYAACVRRAGQLEAVDDYKLAHSLFFALFTLLTEEEVIDCLCAMGSYERCMAAWWLGRQRARGAISALQRAALTDPAEAVRDQAARALEQMDQSSES